MAEFDHGVKIIAAKAARQLARVAGLECGGWKALESTVQATTELLADRVFLARQKRQRFVVYFEFYTTWNRNAPWDMLAKSGLLSRRERLPTVCIAVVLKAQGYRHQNGQFRLGVAAGPTQQLWFRELCLWEVEPQGWWEETPGLMALYPLCRHGRQAREAIRHAADIIESRLPDVGERADWLFLLSIFAGLAYPRIDVAGFIGREKMKESRFAREMREEGKVEAARAFILHLVQARFGSAASSDLAAAVNAVADFKILDKLHDLASTCANLREFQDAIPHQAVNQ